MRKIITTLLLIAVSSVFAANGVYNEKNEIETVTTSGIGQTENAALYIALNKAVMQTNGIAIESRTDVIHVAATNQTMSPGFMNNSLFIGGDITRQSVERSFNGYIRSFEVLSTEKKDANFTVTVKAEVYKYKHPFTDTTDKRARIIVSVFSQAPQSLTINDVLEAAINDKITSTQKFNVLDRVYMKNFSIENNMMLSRNASLADKARLAMVYGSDFMISGTIRRFDLESALREGTTSNRNAGVYKAKLEIEYRLIIPSTLQTKLSEVVEFTLEPEEVNTLWQKTTPADLEIDIPTVKRAIADIVSDKIVDAITEKVYPVLIADVNDVTVYLNEGGKRIEKGDKFDIFNKGKQINDPQTGLSLGAIESKVATVEVSSVNNRIAVAKLVNGSLADVKIGSSCKRVDVENRFVPGTITVTPTLSGQVADKTTNAIEGQTTQTFTPAKLAILPFRISAAKCSFLGNNVSASEIAYNLNEYLITALGQTGKFELLDRSHQDDYSKEVQMILDNSPAEQIFARLEKMIATDYLLVGRLAQFEVRKDKTEIPAASLTTTHYNAKFRFSYSIVEFATRKIAYSNTLDILLNDGQLKNIIPELATKTDREIGESQIEYALLSMAASQATTKLISEIFPMTVIGVTGDTVVINGGKDIFYPGQKIRIYKKGEAMKDPYTGKQLGTFDSQVAIAHITKTEASVSYAKITTGTAEKGNICKVEDGIPQAPAGLKKTNMKVTPSGGVYLPMDK